MSVPTLSTGGTKSCWSKCPRACSLRIFSSAAVASLSSSSRRQRSRSAVSSEVAASNSARDKNTSSLQWQQRHGA
eukprot:6173754-Pleurochrysis_carterae.AAC.2